MRKSLFSLALVSVSLTFVVLTGSGCAKKAPPAVPPTARTEPPSEAKPPAPAPTLSLTASPSTITSGQSSTLSWTSTNATSVTIDGGIGTVEASGTRTVNPSDSTTYNAKASGPGGSANASTRITVTAAVTAPRERELSNEEFFSTHIKDIFFDYDRHDIRDDARRTLQENARALSQRTSIRCTIEGHSDDRGSEKYNLALGDKRANSVKEFLISQGIAGDRLDTVSFGEERPFVPGHSEEAWAQNRRAHFVLK